jgi:hypothetical protein
VREGGDGGGDDADRWGRLGRGRERGVGGVIFPGWVGGCCWVVGSRPAQLSWFFFFFVLLSLLFFCFRI